MARLIFWRLVQLPALLLVIYTLTFVLAWMIPGNPLSLNDARRPEKAIEEAMKAQYSLDDPVKFYWQYLADATGIGLLAGRGRIFDLGNSLRYKDQRVATIVRDALPVSVQLGSAAILLALIIGVG